MSLTTEFASLFDGGTRSRGLDYFRQGNVQRIVDDGEFWMAEVEGSRGESYQVFIDVDDPLLSEADCDCPRFADGYLCKHIWATLLHLEHDGIPFDLDDDEFEPAQARQLTQSGAAANGHGPAASNGAGSNGSAWRIQLRDVAHLRRQYFDSPDNQGLWDDAAEKRTEVWYALNIGQTAARGQFVVDLSVRETKKSGEFGKPKSLAVRRDELFRFTLFEDREALGWLLGNELEDTRQYGYANSYRTDASRLTILPTLHETLLPKLAATGRFVWVLEKDVGLEEARTIHWDDGPPWQFRLKIDEDDAAKCWRITGQMVRGDEVRSLDEPVIMLSTGVVLWNDEMARLDCGGEFAWAAMLRRTSCITVPFEDRDELVTQFWSQAQLPECELPSSLRLEEVRLAPRGRLQVAKEQNGSGYRRSSVQNELYAKVSFAYGEQFVPLDEVRQGLVNPENQQVLLRDREAERQLVQQLLNLNMRRPSDYYSPQDGDVKFAKARFGDVVSTLVKQGWIVEAEGNLIRGGGEFNINVTSGVDWFELDGEVDFDGVSASLPELLAAVRKGEKYVQLGDGTQGILPDDWLEKYGGLMDMGQAEGEALRFRPTQAMLLDAMLAAQENVTVDRGYRNFQKRLQKFDGVRSKKAPRTFHGELRDYQQQGLGWLNFLQKFNFGGCLADDMGLGKTVQVLALLDARRTRRVGKDETRSPSLVVVPKSLVFNWQEEAAKFAPNLRVLDYTGTGRKAKRSDFGEHDIIITTYATMRIDIAHLKETRFDYAILDESQAIKNASSQAAKASRLIQADHRLAMTGTPVENHLGELWSLFEFLNPGMLGSSSTAGSLMKSAGKGEADSLEILRRGLAPYMLRRTKEQVLTELPEKSEQTLFCEMGKKQRKQYDELREYYRVLLQKRVAEVGIQKAKIHVLEALLRLRQAACHPGLIDQKKASQKSAKLDKLLEQLDEVIDEGHQALVFSQFTSLLSIVRKHLDQRKITYEYLDGKTTNRQAKVKRFQEDPDCPVFLISLKAGGHGLNLTQADYVYILDPWWNPAVEAQAVDRAHRIGQERPVFAYRLICRDTVEEKIVELKERKRDLADSIVSADDNVMRSLTADDLQLLLS